MMVSPEDAAYSAAATILNARKKIDPMPNYIFSGILGIFAGMIILIDDINDWPNAVVLAFIICVMYGFLLHFAEYTKHKESIKPIYDWAEEYRAQWESRKNKFN